MKKIHVLLTALLGFCITQAFCASSGPDRGDRSSRMTQLGSQIIEVEKELNECTLLIAQAKLKGISDERLSKLSAEGRSHTESILNAKQWSDLSDDARRLATHISQKDGVANQEAAMQKKTQTIVTGLGLLGSGQVAGGLWAYVLSRDSRNVYKKCLPEQKELARQALRSSRMGRGLSVVGVLSGVRNIGLGFIASRATIETTVKKAK